eukprot:s112_g32.t2
MAYHRTVHVEPPPVGGLLENVMCMRASFRHLGASRYLLCFLCELRKDFSDDGGARSERLAKRPRRCEAPEVSVGSQSASDPSDFGAKLFATLPEWKITEEDIKMIRERGLEALGFDITICDGEVVSTVPDSWHRLGNERIDPRPTLQATDRRHCVTRMLDLPNNEPPVCFVATDYGVPDLPLSLACHLKLDERIGRPAPHLLEGCSLRLHTSKGTSSDATIFRHAVMGLLFLSAIFALCCDHSMLRSTLVSNLSEVLNSEWIFTSIAFLLVSNIMKSEFLPFMAAPIQELGICGLIMKTAGLQWFVLRWGGGDFHDVQTTFLGLLALGVCFAEHLASQPLEPPPKAKTAPAAQASKKAPPPAGSKVVRPSANVPKVKTLARPPRPPARAKATPGRKASDCSEISTTAPSTPRSSGLAVPVTILQPRPRRRAREESSSSSSSELSSGWTSDSECLVLRQRHTVCTFCEAGRFIGATGSSLATECEACPAGRSSSSGSGSCTDCPVGTNALSDGQSACTECPSTNETGSIGCCPGNSEQWPLNRGFSMSLPPGKSASVMHVLSNCQDKVDPLSAELAELVISEERHFEANPLSLATIRPAGTAWAGKHTGNH